MLRKKEVYTTITPIPGFIPRQLAIDILHAHSEVITLNPLVLEHKPIKAPRDAASDEFYSTWYEITERVQFVPGLGKMGSGKISFNGCFHDMPWGLQTHVYAPMNVDLRNTYRIAGNQPGYEPPEPPEIGLAGMGVPADGLYLREDIEIRCNVTMVGFVKSQLKAASKEMVSRIIKKAELLDAGVLQGMIENGKIKTFNPADRTNTGGLPSPGFPSAISQQSTPSPKLEHRLSHSSSRVYQIPRPSSVQPQRPGTAGSQGGYQQQSAHPYSYVAELPAGHDPHHLPQQGPGTASFPAELPVELPANYQPQFQQPQPSPTFHQIQGRSSASSLTPSPNPNTNSWRYSQGQNSPGLPNSRPASFSSESGAGAPGSGFASPGLDKNFATELATHRETQEEHRQLQADPTQKVDPAQRVTGPHGYQGYSYNPQHYANVGR